MARRAPGGAGQFGGVGQRPGHSCPFLSSRSPAGWPVLLPVSGWVAGYPSGPAGGRRSGPEVLEAFQCSGLVRYSLRGAISITRASSPAWWELPSLGDGGLRGTQWGPPQPRPMPPPARGSVQGIQPCPSSETWGPTAQPSFIPKTRPVRLLDTALSSGTQSQPGAMLSTACLGRICWWGGAQAA